MAIENIVDQMIKVADTPQTTDELFDSSTPEKHRGFVLCNCCNTNLT